MLTCWTPTQMWVNLYLYPSCINYYYILYTVFLIVYLLLWQCNCPTTHIKTQSSVRMVTLIKHKTGNIVPSTNEMKRQVAQKEMIKWRSAYLKYTLTVHTRKTGAKQTFNESYGEEGGTEYLTVDCGPLCLLAGKSLPLPGCPLSYFSILGSPLRAGLGPMGTPAEPPCRQLFPMADHGLLALYPGTDRKKHITPEGKHGNISSWGAQVTTVVEDR